MNSYELNLPGLQRTAQACGDATILQRRKLALFCSIRCPGDLIIRAQDYAKNLGCQGLTIISGFHSPIEFASDYNKKLAQLGARRIPDMCQADWRNK